MATTFKVLGQSLPSPNTFTTLYTVPAANSAIISTLNICNVSAANVTFRAAIRPAGATLTTANYIAYDVALPAQDAIGLTLGITLAATDVVTVHSVQGNVVFNLFGSEIY
jgi:hypothetical protein